MNYRIAGRYNIYYSYSGAKKQLKRAGEWVEVYCPIHGWGPTTSDSGCLACYWQDRGLTMEKK